MPRRVDLPVQDDDDDGSFNELSPRDDLVDSPAASVNNSASSYPTLSSSSSTHLELPSLTSASVATSAKNAGAGSIGKTSSDGAASFLAHLAAANSSPSAPPLPSSRPTTTSTTSLNGVLSTPSPKGQVLRPISGFKAGSPSAKSSIAESVKFVSDDGGDVAPRSRAKTHRATPMKVISGMQGTVVPEHHGGLPKMGHTAVCYQHAIYVFGGVNAKGQYSNHIFCHEKRSLAWKEMRGVGVVPRGRANHAAVLVDSKLYVFGGHRQLDVFDDLFAYDMETSRWEKINYEQTQGPGGVFLHSMIYLPSSDSLFVVGGVHHREQNSYLGHLFDIRNRVWSGVPPPAAVNPQHLQLVTAAYHEPSSSVVVLGLTENSSAAQRADGGATVPFVYLFQPQSFAWRRVETPTAPESPLPFRMEAVWEYFLHYLITSGGGLYDPVQQDWMFPFPLAPSSNAAAAAAGASASREGGYLPLMPPPLPANKLGFLILSMQDMTWSMVLCKFPRKLLNEVKAFNDAERLKLERGFARASMAAGSTMPSSLHRLSGAPRQSFGESGVLNGSGLSRVGGGSISGGGGVFGQRSHRRNMSNSSSVGVTWGKTASESGRDSIAGSVKSTAASSAGGSGDRYRRLINFQDVPEFTRKFALVAVRDPPLKNGKLRPMHYLVLHGGLVEPTDYTMLAFAPKLTRTDALAATKQNGFLAGFVRTASYRNLRSTRSTTSNGDSGDDEDGGSYTPFSPVVDTEAFAEVYPTGMLGAKGTGDASGTSYISTADADAYALPSAFLRGPDGDEESATNFRGSEEGSQTQRSFLLPTLPGTAQLSGTGPRFALQYTPQNALHSESFLPYSNIPVAVLQTTQDVHKWSKNYYADQRKWLSEKLKDALKEDRKLRQLRRAANARSGRVASEAGSGARSGRESVQADEISLGEEDSLMESLYLLESMTNLGRGGGPNEKKSSTIQAFEDQLAIEAAAAAVEHKEAPKRRVQDFFEERHLEPFVARDVAQSPQANGTSSTSVSPTKKAKNGGGKSKGTTTTTTTDGAAKPKKQKASVVTANPKKKKTVSKLSTTQTTTPSTVPLPSSIATVVSHSSSAALAGIERMQLKPRRQTVRGGRQTSSYHGGGDGGHCEIARNTSQLLLHNALDRFRADDDTAETKKRKAALRWRYVRALVCTGEASYLLFQASQVQSKMKGVTVSSTPGLVLAPELHLVGPSQAYKVPSKPVPYNVAPSTGVAALPPQTATSASRSTQVTLSGMVIYSSLR